jgi:hypothetical protein
MSTASIRVGARRRCSGLTQRHARPLQRARVDAPARQPAIAVVEPTGHASLHGARIAHLARGRCQRHASCRVWDLSAIDGIRGALLVDRTVVLEELTGHRDRATVRQPQERARVLRAGRVPSRFGVIARCSLATAAARHAPEREHAEVGETSHETGRWEIHLELDLSTPPSPRDERPHRSHASSPRRHTTMLGVAWVTALGSRRDGGDWAHRRPSLDCILLHGRDARALRRPRGRRCVLTRVHRRRHGLMPRSRRVDRERAPLEVSPFELRFPPRWP